MDDNRNEIESTEKLENIPEDDYYEPVIIEADGEQYEIIDAMQYKGRNYVAVIEYDEDEDEDDEEDTIEFMVLEEVRGEDGEICFVTIEENSLYDEIGNAFINRDSDGFIQ